MQVKELELDNAKLEDVVLEEDVPKVVLIVVGTPLLLELGEDNEGLKVTVVDDDELLEVLRIEVEVDCALLDRSEVDGVLAEELEDTAAALALAIASSTVESIHDVVGVE